MPFADQITGAHTEERALRLRGDRLREVRLARPGWSVQQDTPPRCPFPGEEVRELDGQNNGLLQRLLGSLEAGDVIPLHIWFIGDDSTRETCSQLLDFRVRVVIFAFPAPVYGQQTGRAREL